MSTVPGNRKASSWEVSGISRTVGKLVVAEAACATIGGRPASLGASSAAREFKPVDVAGLHSPSGR